MLLSRRSWKPRTLKIDTAACLLCQWRTFSYSYRALVENKPPRPPPTSSSPSALDDAPRANGKAVTEFTPKPLNRPIGLPNPPRAGENIGLDRRTWKQRRDDFVNYDKHLARRKELTQKISTPYFRDWSNMRLHKGKSFLAPPRLFKAERALYIPNFNGRTLIKDKIPRDTTPVFENKVSVVSVFSSAWAESQTATFVSEKSNPELHQAIKNSGGVAQMVQINIEEDALKHLLIRLFMPGLRKKYGASNLGRYFVVKRGVSDEIRDAIGLLNSKVGYTYLLDGQCKIRWAGSGPAEGHEREGLVIGVRRLIEDWRKRKQEKPLGLAQKLAGTAGERVGLKDQSTTQSTV